MSSVSAISKIMARQYSTVFSPYPVISICTVHVQRLCHLYSTMPDRTTEPHLCNCPCLLPISSQYIISTAHMQLEHHLSCPCPVSTPSPVHIQSVHHLFCPSPVRTLITLLITLLAMSSQYIISPSLVQSECHLKLSAHVPSEYHLSYPCLLRDGIYAQKIG